MKLLDRLVAGTFLRNFVLCLLASPPLFILGDITDNLADYLDRGLTPVEVAQAYLYQMPLFLQWSFPIAALIAVVFTIHGMTTHREVVAAKAGGVSFHRLIAPLIFLGVLLTGVALGLTEIIPHGNRISAQILRDEDPRRTFRNDFVYRSEDGLTWQVSRLVVGDSRMSGVVVERPASDGVGGMHALADAAVWDSINGWTFERGYLRRLATDSTEFTVEFEKMRMAGITERPDELLETPREPNEMTYAEIDRMARIIERTGGKTSELMVKREQKLSIPVATLVILLFGAPLATSNKRGGTAFGIGLSLGTVILYLLMLKVSGALGEAGTLQPMAAAWIPNAVFFSAGIVLLAKVRT